MPASPELLEKLKLGGNGVGKGQTTDPGPMARFASLKDDPAFLDRVLDLLTDDEEPLSVWKTATELKVPRRSLHEWLTGEKAVQYDAALKAKADRLVAKALEAANDATPETVGVAKLQAETNLKVAARWDRQRYGEQVQVLAPTNQLADASLVHSIADILRIAAGARLSQERVVEEEPVAIDKPRAA